ncbi:MAG: HNH endonuclease [Phycisphaerae bacterium]
MAGKRVAGRNVLVLWTWTEAQDVEGEECWGSVGAQMRSILKGDRLFVCATHDDELFLLGIIDITKVSRLRRKHPYGSHRAEGRNRSGPFRIIPMGSLKWRLRFESTSSYRLRPESRISSQVQSHRFLTPKSADLLSKTIREDRKHRIKLKAVFEGERREMTVSLSKRERKVRTAAIGEHGRTCMICGFDFCETYGDEYRDCVEVHHLHLLSARGKRGAKTTLDDVIVLCPNCHRAIHSFDDPSAWRRFKRECEL